jgi:threonine dehydrogenase-like Zn-dependent dehydrogenase
MKAIAVVPGRKDSVHLADLPKPDLAKVAHGRGVLVRVLQVGVDATDREINAAEYGQAPPGESILVLGHESFGLVEEVGPHVSELQRGDFVVATVRRPGSSLYDRIGMSDMTTDDVTFERGISALHGFLTEHYVDDAEYIVKVPRGLRNVGVLLEPATVVAKGLSQALEIQRRLRVWRPRTAAIMGAGTIGLLATLMFRLRGMQVTVFARNPEDTKNASLIRDLGGRYVSTGGAPVLDTARRHAPYDLILEATGFSPIVFDAMQVLAKNGVLVLASVTGGDRTVDVPADRINLDFVLGNRVMVGTVNANREHFELAVSDLAKAELEYPGWLGKLLTHKVRGLENYRELFMHLANPEGVIKVFCEVAAL